MYITPHYITHEPTSLYPLYKLSSSSEDTPLHSKIYECTPPLHQFIRIMQMKYFNIKDKPFYSLWRSFPCQTGQYFSVIGNEAAVQRHAQWKYGFVQRLLHGLTADAPRQIDCIKPQESEVHDPANATSLSALLRIHLFLVGHCAVSVRVGREWEISKTTHAISASVFSISCSISQSVFSMFRSISPFLSWRFAISRLVGSCVQKITIIVTICEFLSRYLPFDLT